MKVGGFVPLLFLLLRCSVTFVAAQVGCTTTFNIPGQAEIDFDLTPLYEAGDMSGSYDVFTFKMAVCGKSVEPACAAKTGSFCQYTAAPALARVVNRWDTSAQWLLCADPVACPNGGVQAKFSTGDNCGTTAVWKYTLTVGCTPGGSATTYTVSTNKADPCWFGVTMQHDAGCPAPPKKKSGLSGGSIFLIFLVVIIPVYVVAGCIYKRQRMGAAGIESCPNIDFWRELPGLISDGFKFTVQKLRACCGGSGGGGSGGYETVKEPTLPTL